MKKLIVVTVKRYSHQTTLQEFVGAMPHCGNAFIHMYKVICLTCKTIELHTHPDLFDTRRNAKVDVYVLLVVLYVVANRQNKRPVFL